MPLRPLQDLLPESDYRLFAVCVHFPQNMAKNVRLQYLQEGVYKAEGFGLQVTIVVVSQLPKAEHNAMLLLFSAREELLRYAQEHYRPHSRDTSSVLYRLFRAYGEDLIMPDKLKEFVRQTIDELLQTLPAEERLKGLPVQDRLKGLSAQEVVKALTPEAREALIRELKGNGP